MSPAIAGAALVISLTVTPTAAGAASAIAAQPDQPRVAATAWVALVDRGDYAGSWQAADRVFRNAVTEQQWIEALRVKREPLGVLASRILTSTTALRGTAGVEYFVLDFEARFAARTARETVTVTRGGDGQWRVVGYDVR